MEPISVGCLLGLSGFFLIALSVVFLYILRGRLHRRIEKEIAARIEKEKMRAVGQLAAGLAHELNNPLSVILGFSQSLLRDLSETDAFYQPLQSIERETLRCSRLIRELLAFGRRPEIAIAAESPAAVLEAALTRVASQASVKKIKIVREIPEALPAFEVDRQQIQQLLIHLCSNAMDAMSQGGTLTLRACAKPAHIEIRICDTGEGIPAEIQERIFEPFFTTKPVGKGTGLGLSLCYEIVKAHQGQIDVQSQIGEGTTFIVRLPLRANPLSKCNIAVT